MLEGKELMDELYRYAERFEEFMENKQYSQAKGCYDSVRTTLIVLKADEAMKREFFGERGERGVILKEGLFREKQVQKAYYEAAVKGNDGYENKKYEPLQENSA